MRIDRLNVQNFKRFEQLHLDLNPRFTLLVGDNGAGKTSVLDALAVAASIWLVVPPDRSLAGSRRSILPNEIRLEPVTAGDRTQFVERKPVAIEAIGEIAGEHLAWTREIPKTGVKTPNKQAKEASALIQDVFEVGAERAGILCPVLAYYGAGRAWLPSRARVEKGAPAGPARRWDASYDCFEERIRIGDLVQWFQREAIAAGNHKGRWRPGFDAVRLAILRCVPEADALWFDGDRSDIVLSMQGEACPFSNLSAGQKMMVALIADIAIKAVTQNAYLLPEDALDTAGDTLPDVLRRTPGLILIDELDTHLHPIWQRRVVADLKETFPAMQFVCTSHSPFVIQSLQPGELRTLDASGPVLVEYANQSIEDISEDVQHVPVPQKSRRAQELARATGRYFDLLERAGDMDSEDFRNAERDYRTAVERYSDNPGLSAFLKLQAMAAEKDGKE